MARRPLSAACHIAPALRFRYNGAIMSRALSNRLTLLLALVGCVIALVLTFEHFFPQQDIGCRIVGGDCHGTIESRYGHVGPIPTSLLGLGMYVVVGLIALKRSPLLREAALAGTAAPLAPAAPPVPAEEGEPESSGPLVEAESDENAESGLERDSDDDPTDPPKDEPAPVRSMFGEPPPPPRAASLSPALVRANRDLWALTLIGFVLSVWLQYIALFELETFCPWCFASAVTITLLCLLATRDFVLRDRILNDEQKLLLGVVGFMILVLVPLVGPTVVDQFLKVHRAGARTGNRKAPERDTIVYKGMPLKGDPSAPYTLVEFADYQCSHCKEASTKVDGLLGRYPKQLKLAFRNFPLGHYKWSVMAATATLAAQRQGKFWEMHDCIFAHQSGMADDRFSKSGFRAFAEDIHLDLPRFDKDMGDPALKNQVEIDRQVGSDNGIQMTPTFFLVPANPTGKIYLVEGVKGVDRVPDYLDKK